MKRACTVVLSALVAVLAGCNNPQPVRQVTQPEQPTQKSTLEDQTQPRLATLEQQRMCSEQAEKEFKRNEQDAKKFRTIGTSDFSDYTSHYDAVANVCYVRINTTSASKKVASNIETVFDAFEGRGYASYIWVNAENKKYWEVAPKTCVVYPRGQPEITCKSSEEFKALVDKYFGIGQ
jgi:hypothetical protein